MRLLATPSSSCSEWFVLLAVVDQLPATPVTGNFVADARSAAADIVTKAKHADSAHPGGTPTMLDMLGGAGCLWVGAPATISPRVDLPGAFDFHGSVDASVGWAMTSSRRWRMVEVCRLADLWSPARPVPAGLVIEGERVGAVAGRDW